MYFCLGVLCCLQRPGRPGSKPGFGPPYPGPDVRPIRSGVGALLHRAISIVGLFCQSGFRQLLGFQADPLGSDPDLLPCLTGSRPTCNVPPPRPPLRPLTPRPTGPTASSLPTPSHHTASSPAYHSLPLFTLDTHLITDKSFPPPTSVIPLPDRPNEHPFPDMAGPIPVPPSGVWCPAVTLFDPTTDTLDLASQSHYFSYLAHQTGLAGLVVLGTNAETFLLTREERAALLRLAREVLGPKGKGGVPIMAGVGGHSMAQVREFVQDAVDAGVEYVLVLPPGYFGKVAGVGEVVEGFYDEVVRCCEGTGVGVVVYNFPGVCNGIDLDSETIARLVRKHDSVVGVKLTCGSVAKITRLAAEFPPERFAVFGGQSDFLIGGLAVGSAGCIAAFANVFPKTIVEVYNLYKAGKLEEALALHRKAALAEQALKAGGIAATKYAASVFTAPAAGVENAESKMAPRRPYLPPGEDNKKKIRDTLAEVAEMERSLVK